MIKNAKDKQRMCITSHRYDQIPERNNNLRGGILILAHSFRGVNPSWQEHGGTEQFTP
jgi:hypothetical protein